MSVAHPNTEISFYLAWQRLIFTLILKSILNFLPGGIGVGWAWSSEAAYGGASVPMEAGSGAPGSCHF